MSNPELTLVAIAGPTSTGKSTTARLVQEHYGQDNAQIYPQEFHLKRRGSQEAAELVAELGSMAFEHPRIIDFEAYASNIAALKDGKSIDLTDLPRKLINEGFRPTTILPSGTILIHGVTTYLKPYVNPKTAEQIDLLLWLDLPLDQIRQRRLERAGKSTDPLDSLEHIETVMLPGVEYCLPQRRMAHHIIDASRSPEEVRDEIISYIDAARSRRN